MSADNPVVIGWGLGIRSAIELPGAIAAPLNYPVAIEIDFGAVPLWKGQRSWGPYRVADADLFDFDMPGIARYTCINRNRVLVSRADRAKSADVASMLMATVLPALLWARGEFVLHGAAAIAQGATSAVIIAGASGIGKTTMLVRALNRGATCVADDSVRLRLEGGSVIASGLSGGTWVRPPTGVGVREFRPVAPAKQCVEAPAGRLFVAEPGGVGRQRLVGPQALAALLRHRHRPRITTLLATEADFLQRLGAIAHSLQIVSVSRGNFFGAP